MQSLLGELNEDTTSAFLTDILHFSEIYAAVTAAGDHRTSSCPLQKGFFSPLNASLEQIIGVAARS